MSTQHNTQAGQEDLPPLPEPSAFAAGMESNMRGFIDVMAWNEGEFTTALFTADQLREAQRAAIRQHEERKQLACDVEEFFDARDGVHFNHPEYGGGSFFTDDCRRSFLSPTPSPAVNEPVADPPLIESIAQQWDGCMYGSVGEDIDIGEAIRVAAKRMSPVVQTTQAQPSEGEWQMRFSNGRDFCRFASLLIGATYVSPKDALQRFHDQSLWGERTHGKVSASGSQSNVKD